MPEEEFIFSKLGNIVFEVLYKTGIVRNLLDIVFPFYGKVNNFNPNEFRMYAIGQSHLDTAWNWTWDWTKRKIRKTFGNALYHLDIFPNFKFSAPAPVHYEYFEKAYPSMFKKIQHYVKKNRWDIVGGMYCEPDGNVPDGESLVRQRLYGQKYFIEKFGKRSLVAWLPDSFGFTWTYPQIFLKSGSPYFHTTKMTWNLEHEFPFALFWWEGPDGSKVLAHNFKYGFRALESVGKFKDLTRLIPEGKESPKYNYSFDFKMCDIRNNDFVNDFGHWYGFGDGGAGPLYVEILIPETFRKTKGWQFIKASTYFKLIQKKYGKRLPIWKDELYLEVHRGCQTTLYRIKKMNRLCEKLLTKFEKLLISASIFDKNSKNLHYPIYNLEEFDNLWKKLLFNQFHDILPGSSIEEVYDDADNDYRFIINTLSNSKDKIEAMIIDNFKEGVINLASQLIFQPNHWKGKLILFDEKSKDRIRFRVINKNKSGIGFQLIKREKVTISKESHIIIEKNNEIHIGTLNFKIIFNKQNASITSLKAKIDDFKSEFVEQNEFSKGEGLNRLRIFVDEPKSNDAWNIDPDYRKKELNTIISESYKIFNQENGFPCLEIQFNLIINQSKGILRYIIHDDLPYIICQLNLDYQEHRKILRTEFDTSIQSDKITTALAYGMIDRPTIPKTPLEKGRWEFPGQKFISLSDGKIGLSILCENRYGFNSIGSKFGMSLKKAPLYGNPDGFMNVEKKTKNKKLLKIAAIPKEKRKLIKDLGDHEIRWAIYPHLGDWKEANTYQTFFNFTDNPILFDKVKIKPIDNLFLSLFDCDLENVRISTLKPCYGFNKNLVIRIFEFQGKKSVGKLFLNPLLFQNKLENFNEKYLIYNADLLEGSNFVISEEINKQLKYDLENSVIKFQIEPYEIKTIVVKKREDKN